MMYPFRWPRPGETPSDRRSAAAAKRRLHDTLPIDRARAAADHDDAESLLRSLLQEEPRPSEQRPT